ncbi:hypothetical protein [Chelonobacter oris]|uniref:hypothetical protein n=1 Tax=Chelonobacter oris TaxID=505317 RepID=UPI001376A0EF|nr:hypothetical protein [Chelonobacter oris]
MKILSNRIARLLNSLKPLVKMPLVKRRFDGGRQINRTLTFSSPLVNNRIFTYP